MLKGLAIYQGKVLNSNWDDRMIIDEVPVVIQPVGASATAVAGGSLAHPVTYYYKITAIGINGESVGSTEVNATTSGTNKTIDLAWTAQTYVTEYKVYRGIVAGNYTGYTTVFTNSLADDGTLSFNTLGIITPPVFPNIPPTSTMYGLKSIMPPVSNSIAGTQTTYGGITWNGKRSSLIFSQLTIKGYTFIPAVVNDTDNIKAVSKIHINYKSNKDIAIDTFSVVYPANWNTPNSDAGVVQAMSDIESWVTTL